MLPELSPTFAALARARAASQPGSPGPAVPSEAEGATGSFADEVSGPAAVTREDDPDRPERKAADPAEEDRAETDEAPQADRPAAASEPAPTGTCLVEAALAAGGLPASPALTALTGETAADPLAAGLAGAPAGRAPAVLTPPTTGALAAAAARAASTAAADPGEAPAARTAESAEADTTGDTAVDPDGTGLRPGTDMARTAAGRPDLSARAGLTATPAADRTVSDASPALPPPAAASAASAPTTAPAMTDPRPVLAAHAGAPDGGDPGTETDPGTLPDRATGDPGAIAPAPAGDRGSAAALDTTRSGEPRSTAAQPLGSQILDGIRQARDGSIEIALSPEELGSLKLTLAGDDTRLHVQIHAERPETEGLLRRHIALLQQDFRDLGYGHVSFDFGTRQDRPARYEAAAGHAGGSDDALDPVAAATPTLRLAALPAMTGRGLDLRL